MIRLLTNPPLWRTVAKVLLCSLLGSAGSEIGRAAGKRLGRKICPGYDQPPGGGDDGEEDDDDEDGPDPGEDDDDEGEPDDDDGGSHPVRCGV